MTPELAAQASVLCSVCRGRKWLPVEGGTYDRKVCDFCHGTGTNQWYEDNVRHERAKGIRHRRFWTWFCILYPPLYVVGVWGQAGALWPLFFVNFFVIWMAIRLFSTRNKTPWAQDEVVFTAITIGAIWAARNNRRGRR